MKLVILGATGGIGRLLVAGALGRGHSVTVFARSPHKVLETHPNLKVLRGDLFDEQGMAAALAGHDAVLSAFGPTILGPTTQRRDFGRTLVAAMRKSDVRRALLVSSAFLFRDGGLFVFLLSHSFFYFVAQDMAAMEQPLLSSGLDWTIVRPPRLTNGPQTGAYRVRDAHLPTGGLLIARGDVADFMLAEVERGAHIQQIVGVSN